MRVARISLGKFFNVLQSPIGRMASLPMRNIKTFPSKQMYLYLSLVERKAAQFYHNMERRRYLVWLKSFIFITSWRELLVSLSVLMIVMLLAQEEASGNSGKERREEANLSPASQPLAPQPSAASKISPLFFSTLLGIILWKWTWERNTQCNAPIWAWSPNKYESAR